MARRKLFPALYNLSLDGLLPPGLRVLGLSRRAWSDEALRETARAAVAEFSRRPIEVSGWERFATRLQFARSDEEGMGAVAAGGRRQRLVYLSTPPSVFEATVEALARQGLVEGTRLMVEKPFGSDLASAQALDVAIRKVFDELQVLRIDHYLGKEMVQNLLALRFDSPRLAPLWDRRGIAAIQVTLAETLGVEERGGFYEEVGALRDVVQNHALQILALLTMEPPAGTDAESVRDAKVALLASLEPPGVGDAVHAQYTAGTAAGAVVPGYREEAGVDAASQTETYVAARLGARVERWEGVPLYVRAGKRLARSLVEVRVQFRRDGEGAGQTLGVRIQPEQGDGPAVWTMEAGAGSERRPLAVDFAGAGGLGGEMRDAYETVLAAAFRGDHSLFVRADEVQRSWEVVQPLLERPPLLRFYAAGSWGPSEAETLAAPGGWLGDDA